MKSVIYTCPYVPAEWIAVHDMVPSRIVPGPANPVGSLVREEGVCPYIRGFIDEAIADRRASGIVMTTVCDQMRRAFDILIRRHNLPAFLMNVPSTWQSLGAQKLYIDELKRLGRFLVQLGGKPFSSDDLAQVMLEYDTVRSFILAARPYLSARQYAEAILAFNRAGPDAITQDGLASKPLTAGIPLAIVGGPLMKQDFDMFDMVEHFGRRVVLNATENGERGMCPPFDRRRLHDDPLMELANAYFGGIQDASRRPNNELYRWLKQEFVSRGVRGIIFRRYVWCDIWHAELWRLKDWIDLPVLDLVMSGERETDRQRTANRIQAFLEILSDK